MSYKSVRDVRFFKNKFISLKTITIFLRLKFIKIRSVESECKALTHDARQVEATKREYRMQANEK